VEPPVTSVYCCFVALRSAVHNCVVCMLLLWSS